MTRLAAEGCSLGCCPANIVEVYAGMKEGERQATKRLLDSLHYYEVTREIAELAGEYRRQYLEKGVMLSLSDVIIAAVAASNKLVLVTGNPKHYPMPELSLQHVVSEQTG